MALAVTQPHIYVVRLGVACGAANTLVAGAGRCRREDVERLAAAALVDEVVLDGDDERAGELDRQGKRVVAALQRNRLIALAVLDEMAQPLGTIDRPVSECRNDITTADARTVGDRIHHHLCHPHAILKPHRIQVGERNLGDRDAKARFIGRRWPGFLVVANRWMPHAAVMCGGVPCDRGAAEYEQA